MNNQIEKIYEKIGIDIKANKFIREYIDFINVNDQIIKKQFELFHMDFLLGLNNIKEFDPKSFKRYIDKINQTKEGINFWGEKFEVYIHSKLIQGVSEFIQNLKRGRDGIEPDLIFNYNNDFLGIELTTLKFTNNPKTNESILSKITDKILEKNKNPYSNEKCALIIDITNIIFYEKKLNISINQIFKELFNGFKYLNKEINFGAIVLCYSSYRQNVDGTLKHVLKPKILLIDETKNVEKNLNEFLNFLFNNFKSDNDLELEFHHPFM